MWASKATYLTQVGQVYSKITEQAVDAIIVRFFGFFFLAWQTAELWGNLISSLVISNGPHGGGGDGNDSANDHVLQTCGANFCVIGSASHGNLERPPESEIFEISMIYLSCIIGAVLIIAIFLIHFQDMVKNERDHNQLKNYLVLNYCQQPSIK